MKIYAPNRHANGVYASVMFHNGVGETDDPSLIRWFETHGYKVGESITEAPKYTETFIEDITQAVESEDLDSMTVNELREWCRLNGIAVGGARNKEKILAIIRGE